MIQKPSRIAWLLIALFALVLAIALPRPAPAQLIPFLPQASEETAPSKAIDWLDTNKAFVCGKAWCVNVYFPYFPYDFIDQDLTIAAFPDLKEPEVAIKDVEIRAQVIQSTMLSIFKKVQKATIAQQNYDLADSTADLIFELQQWLPDVLGSKPLHPVTPLVEVGTKNEQTVLFVPEQPDVGLAAETIVTINRADALINGKSIEEVAQFWRGLVRTNLSEALWGAEFDRRYPWARPVIIAGILLAIFIPILLFSGIRNLLRSFKRSIRIRLRELKDNVAVMADDEGGEVIVAPPSASAQESQTSAAAFTSTESSDSAAIAHPQKTFPFRVKIVKQLGEKLSNRLRNTLNNLPELTVKQQALLKQLLNLMEFLLRLLFWIRILILFLGFSAIAVVYPNTRVSALYFLGQAIIIPAIWMVVALADTLTAFLIDRYLNQWAEEGQLLNPGSNRYTLRVSTYSPALKGASALAFIVLGGYLTIIFMGIDTSVLAGAGAVALLIGFLSRNVLEDMLNGALILLTDRYAIGDVISIGSMGGRVEQMNLYTTQLRGAEGRLITIPNGQVKSVENKTKDWSRVDFKVEIAYDADARQALGIIEQITAEMQGEPEWQESMLSPAIVLGVDQVSNSGSMLQVWIKTQPMRQWSVGRELRLRVKQAFDEAGIHLGVPQREIIQRDHPVGPPNQP